MDISGMPLVSVVICTYNRDALLRGAISSVINGKYKNIEIIVSDNADSAVTRAVVESFQDSRLRYRANSTNLGVAGNHRAALKEMCGSLFGILCDDDEWEPDLLAKLVPVLVRDESLAVAFSDHYIIDSNGRIDLANTVASTRRWQRDTLRSGSHRPFHKIGLVQQSFSMAMGAVVRTAAIELWDFPLEVGSAFDLWLTYLAARTGLGAYYLPDRLARYRSHSASQTAAMSPENLRAAQYVYSRLLDDPKLTEFHDCFRKRHSEMEAAECVALLRAGRIPEARARLRSVTRSRKNIKLAAALLLAVGGAAPARLAFVGYDHISRALRSLEKG
jgi:glycosyltransferase involved in cell wall biosynthesis